MNQKDKLCYNKTDSSSRKTSKQTDELTGTPMEENGGAK